MSMAEFVTRAVRDPDQSLTGVRVRLAGFVAPNQGQEGGYRLTRFVIFCCATDAEALQAVVQGDPTPRARDQWLEVEGTWQPRPPAEDDPTARRRRPCTPTWSVPSPQSAHPTSTPSSSLADYPTPPLVRALARMGSNLRRPPFRTA